MRTVASVRDKSGVLALETLNPPTMLEVILTIKTGTTTKKITPNIRAITGDSEKRLTKNITLAAKVPVPGRPIMFKLTAQVAAAAMGCEDQSPVIEGIDLVPNLL
jgi:hypothetical protein